jgi:hypothetical protein
VANTVFHDPLGRAITLHDHTWYGHILPGHPELADHLADVAQAITNPLEIRFSDADPNCRIYFGVGPRRGIIMAVVANVAGGFVKTAHMVKRAKGVVEWSKPTP